MMLGDTKEIRRIKKMNEELPDIQNKAAEIQIPLSRVGVENVEKYIQINRESGSFNLTAKLNMYVELDHEHKGVNMNVRRSRGKDIDAACGQLAGKDK